MDDGIERREGFADMKNLNMKDLHAFMVNLFMASW
jgi:hypothetical protein